jgi:hypothetical protein
MPRNNLTRDEFKVRILKLKKQLAEEKLRPYNSDPKDIANKYLNDILDILDEYRY